MTDSTNEIAGGPSSGASACSMPEFTDELRWILGRPCFWCARYAAALRKDGQAIETKAEAEQAAVIYWMLRLYSQHGTNWFKVADSELKRILASATNPL